MTYTNLLAILLYADAILPDGGVNADYLLVGVMTLFCYLIWNLFREIKVQLKEHSDAILKLTLDVNDLKNKKR